MKTINLLFLIITFMTLISCDPFYQVEFEIDNTSSHSLEIKYFSPLDSTTIVNVISGQTKLTFFEISGIGQKTETVLDELESLPFDSIFITVLDSVSLKKDPNDFDNWQKLNPESDSSPGTVKLFLRPFEFE